YQGGTAYDVVLVDQLPAGVSFVSSSHSADYDPDSNTVTWNLGNLAPGASIPGWLTVKIDAGLPDNTELTDTFSVTWKDRLGNSYGPATASWDTTVYTRPELLIEKTGPSEARPGDTISYKIKVTNIGGTAAFDVVIMDILPVGFTYSSSDPSGTPVNGMVTWSVGTIPAYGVKEVSVTFKVDEGIVENVVLVNTATVTWKDSLGLEWGPKGTAKEVAIYTLSQLKIEKIGPSTTHPDSTFSYIITVHNVGGTAASTVILTDTLPTGLSYVSSNPSGTESPTGTITWNLGTIDPGGTVTITLNVQVKSDVPDNTPLNNIASVSWKHNDVDLGPSEATWNTRIVAPAPTPTATPTPAPTPRPVGGVVAPANKLEILAPYLTLAGLVTVMSAVVVFRKRR
ncbi:MAG: DUF11 domain-containing protein, partial [Candidatus Bathyarchaeia archaeon]